MIFAPNLRLLCGGGYSRAWGIGHGKCYIYGMGVANYFRWAWKAHGRVGRDWVCSIRQ